jgi:bleomycin hydrolase
MQNNVIMKYSLVLSISLLLPFVLFAQHSGSINNKELEQIRSGIDCNLPNEKASINAITANDINNLSINREVSGKTEHYFRYKVDVKGITDQKKSGRCWMFAGLNTIRPIIIDEKNLSEFEFSTNYLFFWDQFEKANLFLESIINTCDLPTNDRMVEWLFKNPIGDGGVWNSYANLIEKYGVVPSRIMPETYHSENTRMLNNILSTKLRQQALELRELSKGRKSNEVLYSTKVEMLKDIYRILVLCLGEPPTNFEYRFIDKDDTASEIVTYSPQSFFKKLFPDYHTNDYVMLMNDPTREYYKMYEIELDRNVLEGKNWKYLNLPNKEIKQFALESIKNNEAMYASCDVGKFKNNDEGTLNINNYDFESLFGVDLSMDKAARITTYASGSSHAMLLMAVDTDEKGQTEMWQFENSWGASIGHKGYLSFTDDWFNEYMFRVVINKKYLDAKTIKLLDQDAIILPPWDPMFLMDE